MKRVFRLVAAVAVLIGAGLPALAQQTESRIAGRVLDSSRAYRRCRRCWCHASRAAK